MLTVHKHKIALVKDKAQKEKGLETDGIRGGTALLHIVELLPPDSRCGPPKARIWVRVPSGAVWFYPTPFFAHGKSICLSRVSAHSL